MPFGPDDFVGEALCLDFVNTVGGHREGEPKETLNTYADLLEWAVVAGVLTKSVAEQLRGVAEESDARAARVLADAKRLREAIYEIFVAFADGEIAHVGDRVNRRILQRTGVIARGDASRASDRHLQPHAIGADR